MIELPLSKLIPDEKFYIRQNINEAHVNSMLRSLKAKQTLPPIVVWKRQKRGKFNFTIIDGIHRYQAYSRFKNGNTIPVEIRKYFSHKEAFKDAVLLNSAHGLRLDEFDSIRIIDIGTSLGFKELELAGLLRTSLSHLRLLENRYATVEEAKKGVKAGRRVALKASLRHLAGTMISLDQEQAMGSAPGQSYLLTIDQLISAIRYKLLPPREQHEALWERMAELRTLLNKLFR